ncbi:MAG: hypothetical protein IT369_01055, partial [Candidatus Latescibacteria bacterium]|nr:hypothetical protein [Candidatus Latescibacterota bacterium]
MPSDAFLPEAEALAPVVVVVEAPEPPAVPEDDPNALTAPPGEEIVFPPESALYEPPPPGSAEVYPPFPETLPSPAAPPELGQPPVLDPIESQSVEEGQTLSFPVKAHDPDAGQAVAI